jgi:hypothetical protein
MASALARIEDIESSDYFIGSANYFYRPKAGGETKLMRLVGRAHNGARKFEYIGKDGHDEANKKIALGDELVELRKRVEYLKAINKNFLFRLQALGSEFRGFDSEYKRSA